MEMDLDAAPSPEALSLSTEAREAALRRLHRFSFLMDSSVRVPFTNATFGLESALGLVPVVGDAAGAVLACYVPYQAVRLGAPRSMIARMLFNILVDALAGLVPVLGDAFDLYWKANVRNVQLLERWLAE